MSFRNDAQRGRVAQVLTDRLHKGAMWVDDEHGIPRPNAIMRTHLRSCFSTVETSLCRLAWDVWNGGGGALISTGINSYDSTNLRMVGELLIAIGESWDRGTKLDEWIHRYDPERMTSEMHHTDGNPLNNDASNIAIVKRERPARLR